MKFSIPSLLLCTVLSTAAVACDDADAAKKEAEAKAEEANKSAREAAAKASAEAQNASAKVAEAAAATKKAALEAQASLTKDVDDAERKATALKEKAAKLTGAKKANADAALVEYDKRVASTKAEVAKVANATGDALETAKAKAKAEIDGLKKSVDNFETTINK